MTYPNKLYIELRKTKANKKHGLSFGQVVFIRNFMLTKVNISRKQSDLRSGVDYKVTALKDYKDMIEVEFTRLKQI